MYTAKDRKNYQKLYRQTCDYLKNKNQVLFLTTSNRWSGESGGEQPKSVVLAEKIAKRIGEKKVKIIDVSKLKIYTCEGNVSTAGGNTCGPLDSLLKDKTKNPSGYHRCWASINNPDDELWEISKPLLNSACVVFFVSVRWGQTNSIYQKLIERLNWLENRHTTLGENNVLKNIETGIIAIGHNWRGREVVATQKQVLAYFGFKVIDQLCWHWEYTEAGDESNASYKRAALEFKRTFRLKQ